MERKSLTPEGVSYSGFAKEDRQECLSYLCAVALLVFLPGAAGTRIVAPHFRANSYRLRRFGLRGAGLILQILLLTLLAAFDLARHSRQLLRFTCTRCCACGRSGRALRGWSRWCASVPGSAPAAFLSMPNCALLSARNCVVFHWPGCCSRGQNVSTNSRTTSSAMPRT